MNRAEKFQDIIKSLYPSLTLATVGNLLTVTGASERETREITAFAEGCRALVTYRHENVITVRF